MDVDLSEVSNETVLNELFRGMPSDHRAVLCTVGGDPSTVEPFAWHGIPWALGSRCALPANRNNYVAQSAFGQSDDKRFRRRKEQFRGLYALMIDDVGTKIDWKEFNAMITKAELWPTMVVETSPGNYQVTYFLESPVLDQEVAEDCIRQLIKKLTGDGLDPGMSGITRVLRLPVGINNKPKYKDVWNCRLALWRPDIRTPWIEILRTFGLVQTYRHYVEPNDSVTLERKRCFTLIREALEALRIIKRSGRGWIEIRCPWVANHTDRANTGAAVAYPAKANGYVGGFRCHHGHCSERGWSDLENWVMDEVIRDGCRRAGPFYRGEA